MMLLRHRGERLDSGVPLPPSLPRSTMITIVPSSLVFKQRPLCIPGEKMAQLTNGGDAELSVFSVTTDSVHFRPCSSFKATTLAPGEALNISIVFLPRTVGSVEATLVIQTSVGALLYQIHAQGVATQLRIRDSVCERMLSAEAGTSLVGLVLDA